MKTYPDMKIVGKILDMDRVVGFVVVDTSGKPKNYKSSEVMQMAREDKFINAYIQEDNSTKLLFRNCNLNTLQTYRVKKGKRENVKNKQKEIPTKP